MKLSELIDKLQKIQNKYGNMTIEGNILGGERMELSSLCIEDNFKYGMCDENSDVRYNLLIELEEYCGQWKPLLRVYEYPSNEDVEL